MSEPTHLYFTQSIFNVNQIAAIYDKKDNLKGKKLESFLCQCLK